MDTLRRVWATMTTSPQRPKAAMMHELGLSRTTFYAALYVLQEAGYIEHPEQGGWVVVVPFIVTGKPNAGALN